MKLVIRCFFISLLLFTYLPKLEAENCPCCPAIYFNGAGFHVNYDRKHLNQGNLLVHEYNWGNFHCDQIRRLRDQVESVLEVNNNQQEYIESLQRQIEVLQNEIRYIRKWTFLGEPAFEVEQE